MVKYLIASHVTFSKGTKDFLDFMIGTNANVYTLCAFLDDQSLDQLINNKIKEIGVYDQLLIFVDIHGGSVEQALFLKFCDDAHVKIISGYNLALVMEIIFQNKVLNDDEIQLCINSCHSSIVNLKKTNLSDDDQDLI